MDARPRSKHWVLTLNNPEPSDLVKAPGESGSKLAYLILGQEVGEDGTPHLQGYCCFINRQYLSGAKKIWPRAHLEIRRGSITEAIEYCKKDGDWEEWGAKPITKEQGTKKRWDFAYECAKKGEFEEIPKDMLVRYYRCFKHIHQDNPPKHADLKEKKNYWVLAPSQYGKSRYARKRWPDFYDKSPNKWWMGYKQEETILCDDFGPHQCQYLGWYMKRWADNFSFPMETKGGGCVIRPKHIVVTSQYSIEACFPDPLVCEAINNRFSVIELPHWKKRIDSYLEKVNEMNGLNE